MIVLPNLAYLCFCYPRRQTVFYGPQTTPSGITPRLTSKSELYSFGFSPSCVCHGGKWWWYESFLLIQGYAILRCNFYGMSSCICLLISHMHGQCVVYIMVFIISNLRYILSVEVMRVYVTMIFLCIPHKMCKKASQIPMLSIIIIIIITALGALSFCLSRSSSRVHRFCHLKQAQIVTFVHVLYNTYYYYYVDCHPNRRRLFVCLLWQFLHLKLGVYTIYRHNYCATSWNST